MNRSMRELMAAGFRDRRPEWSDAQVGAPWPIGSSMPAPDELSLFATCEVTDVDEQAMAPWLQRLALVALWRELRPPD